MASTSRSNMLSLQTPIFTRNNYEYWSLTMKALFIGQDVWDIVQNGYVEPLDKRGRKLENFCSTYTKPCMKAYSQE